MNDFGHFVLDDANDWKGAFTNDQSALVIKSLTHIKTNMRQTNNVSIWDGVKCRKGFSQFILVFVSVLSNMLSNCKYNNDIYWHNSNLVLNNVPDLFYIKHCHNTRLIRFHFGIREGYCKYIQKIYILSS